MNMDISTSTFGSKVAFIKNKVEFIEELKNLIITSVWSPSVYKNDYRKKDNFLYAELVGLDFDNNPGEPQLSLQEATNLFRNCWHVIGTTRSHQKEKDGKPASDRFRVILRLDQVCKNYRDYEHTMRLLMSEYPAADPAGKDAARMFYPCTEIISENFDGIKIKLIQAPEKKTVEVPNINLKGELSASTLKFLHFGAASGKRNNLLYKAARDFYQNNYTLEEFQEQSEQAFGLTGLSKEEWDNTVNSAFSRDPEFPPNIDEEVIEVATNLITPKDLLKDTFSYLSNKDQVMGEPTGLHGIDKLLGGGLRGGELIGLVAQAGAGKSSLLHKIQVNLSLRGHASGYLSQEMRPDSEVIPNYLSILCQENAWKAEMTEERRERYMEEISKMKVYFSPERGHIPFDQIKTWITYLAQSENVKFFFLDHLAFCQKESENYAEASELIRSLKKLCTDLNVTLISIIQPQKLQFGQSLGLESMRGGAALNQACDMVLTMERENPHSFDNPQDARNVSKIQTVKARHKLSKLGKCHIKYNPITTDIEDCEITWEDKSICAS